MQRRRPRMQDCEYHTRSPRREQDPTPLIACRQSPYLINSVDDFRTEHAMHCRNHRFIRPASYRHYRRLIHALLLLIPPEPQRLLTRRTMKQNQRMVQVIGISIFHTPRTRPS